MSSRTLPTLDAGSDQSSDVDVRGSLAVLLVRALSWACVPAVLVMSLFDLRRGLTGKPSLISSFAIGATVAIALGVPVLVWAVRRRRDLRPHWALVLVFMVLLAYSLVSAFTNGTRVAYHLVVPRPYLVMPIVEAALTCLLGLVLALAVPTAQRRSRYWWMSWALIVGSLVEWVRGALRSGITTRLNTGLGGAATLQLPLLLVLAGFLAAMLEGQRRGASVVGALITAGLVVATGSRAGVVLLAALLVSTLVLSTGARVVATLRWALLVVVAIGLAVALTPYGQRFVHWTDVGRMQNVQVVGRALDSPLHWLFGVGVGTIWPWFIYDAGLTRAPYRGLQTTKYGITATNPHSLYLGALGELGLVGLSLVLVLLVLCVRAWLRSLRAANPAGAGRESAASGFSGPLDADLAWSRLMLTMIVLSWLAFAVDYYLLKNFALSFIWWFSLFLALPRRACSATERAA